MAQVKLRVVAQRSQVPASEWQKPSSKQANDFPFPTAWKGRFIPGTLLVLTIIIFHLFLQVFTDNTISMGISRFFVLVFVFFFFLEIQKKRTFSSSNGILALQSVGKERALCPGCCALDVISFPANQFIYSKKPNVIPH